MKAEEYWEKYEGRYLGTLPKEYRRSKWEDYTGELREYMQGNADYEIFGDKDVYSCFYDSISHVLAYPESYGISIPFKTYINCGNFYLSPHHKREEWPDVNPDIKQEFQKIIGDICHAAVKAADMEIDGVNSHKWYLYFQLGILEGYGSDDELRRELEYKLNYVYRLDGELRRVMKLSLDDFWHDKELKQVLVRALEEEERLLEEEKQALEEEYFY